MKKSQTVIKHLVLKEDSINSYINKELLLKLTKIIILNSEGINDEFADIARSSIKIGFKLKLKNVMPLSMLKEFLFQIIYDEEFQNQLIKNFVKSPLYKDFISEVIYNTIRDFLLEDNFITLHIPVAGKIMKFGQNVATSTMNKFSNATEFMEKTIKIFIEKNLQVIEGYTSTIIKKTITEKNLENIVNFTWEVFKDRELFFDEKFFSKSKENLTELGLQIIDTLIDSVLEKYGDAKLSDILKN